MAFKKAQCKNVKSDFRKRRLLFAANVQRTHNERLTRRAMFRMTDGGEIHHEDVNTGTGPNV